MQEDILLALIAFSCILLIVSYRSYVNCRRQTALNSQENTITANNLDAELHSEDDSISLQTQIPEGRRDLVLSSIIIKKVLSSKSDNKQSCKLTYHQTDNGATEETITSSPSSDSNRADFFDDDPDIKKCKENIIAQSFRSLSSTISHNVDSKNSTLELYSPQSCSICLEYYREGEEICWSRNKKCAHAFHLDCMLDWLQKHDDCPLCREDYMIAPE